MTKSRTVAMTKWMRHRRAVRRQRGLCQMCGRNEPAPDREACSECLARARASQARVYSRYEAAGMCKRCGEQPPAPGLKKCRPCLDYQREQNRDCRLRARAAKPVPRIPAGVPVLAPCGRCGLRGDHVCIGSIVEQALRRVA